MQSIALAETPALSKACRMDLAMSSPVSRMPVM
jgi:hypothetical protein